MLASANSLRQLVCAIERFHYRLVHRHIHLRGRRSLSQALGGLPKGHAAAPEKVLPQLSFDGGTGGGIRFGAVLGAGVGSQGGEGLGEGGGITTVRQQGYRFSVDNI